MKARNEDPAPYRVDVAAAIQRQEDNKNADDKERDDLIIAKAISILEKRLHKAKDVLDSPSLVMDFLRLNYSLLEREHFGVFYLTVQNGLIKYDVEFNGTLSQCSVHPREIVKKALALNAGAVVFCHNHPSGLAKPSGADVNLTNSLKAALALVDVRVLDHLIVGQMEMVSMAEAGLI